MQKILLIEDDLIMGESICDRFAIEKIAFKWATSAEEAFLFLSQQPFDCMVSDIRLPDMSGEDLYIKAQKAGLINYPAIFITGFGTQLQAERLLTLGASDYLIKPLDLEQLINKIKLLEMGESHSSISETFPTLGVSTAIQKLEKIALTLGTNWTAIMISGESGAGKEEFARLLHRQAHLEDGPFITVNCGAISETLIEAELFGYEKGSFTGAIKSHKGVFEQANHGTIFLDEIGELTLNAQVKLLRVLQEQFITRIGAEKPIKLNFRIITASNRDLREEVKCGNFREDLYYRINIIHLKIPPLRERPEDIDWLARLFIGRWNDAHPRSPRMLSEPTLNFLKEQQWRGNVRELKHAIERACLLAAHPFLRPGDFEISEQLIAHQIGQPTQDQIQLPFPIVRLADFTREQEKKYLSLVLNHFNGHVGQAASALGISRKTLWEKSKN
jgi:DNA-binding NtrC family response regulator